MSTGEDSIRESVRARYEAHPFPARDYGPFPVSRLARFNIETLRYACYRQYRCGRGLRILELGCGTGHSTRVWAAANPDCEITAIDFSEKSVATARFLLRDHENVRIEVADLLDFDPPEAFDLVVAEGVLHHLPDLRQGFERVRRFLREDGLCVILIYGSLGRWEVGILQQALGLLLRPGEDRLDAIRVARNLVGELRPGGRLWGFRSRYGSLLDHDSELVDLLLHPCEHRLDVAELFALLEGAGLRHLLFHDESAWEIAEIFQNEELRERAHRLPPPDRYRLADLLHAGRNHYELIADARDPSSQSPEARWRETRTVSHDVRPLLPPFTILEEGEANLPSGRQKEHRVTYYRIGVGRRTEVLQSWQRRFLDRSDGRRTVSEMVETVGRDDGSPAVDEINDFVARAEQAGFLWFV